MDTSQWPQEAAIAQTAATSPAISERRIRRKNDQKQLNCPRCNSNNTKFCYYNNYSLTQPRHFCKTCRRYWTEGGSLRNIPVGGGSRKNKRSSAAAAAAATSSSAAVSINGSSSSSSMQKNPKFGVEAQDLNLGFQQVGGSGMSGRQMGGDFMHEVLGLQELRGRGLGLGFQVGAGGAAEQDEGRFLFSSQNRGGGGGDAQGFWNGMMGGGGNW